MLASWGPDMLGCDGGRLGMKIGRVGGESRGRGSGQMRAACGRGCARARGASHGCLPSCTGQGVRAQPQADMLVNVRPLKRVQAAGAPWFGPCWAESTTLREVAHLQKQTRLLQVQRQGLTEVSGFRISAAANARRSVTRARLSGLCCSAWEVCPKLPGF